MLAELLVIGLSSPADRDGAWIKKPNDGFMSVSSFETVLRFPVPVVTRRTSPDLAAFTSPVAPTANRRALRCCSSLTPPPTPRGNLSRLFRNLSRPPRAFSDKFYVIGGFSGDRASSQIWELDLDSPTATWTERAPLPAEGRGYAAVTAVGSQLYVFGGFTSPPSEPQTKIFGDADRYEPATNVWKRLEGFDMPGYAWTATAIGERQILLIGRVPKLKTVTDEVGLVDLETMKARSIGRLITPACCMPAMPNGVKTWWFPGVDPDTNRNRTTRTSILTFYRSI